MFCTSDERRSPCTLLLGSVVGVDDEHGVIPQFILVHGVQHLSQIVVAHGHQRTVAVPAVLCLLRRLRHFRVWRPVKFFPGVIRIRKQLAEPFGGEEGLVGIEGLDLQKPVVRVVILVDKLQPVAESYRLGHIFLMGEILTVDRILTVHIRHPRQFHGFLFRPVALTPAEPGHIRILHLSLIHI